MAEKPVRAGEVMLRDVRLSHPKLFVPSSSVEDGPIKFRTNFLIDENEDLGAKNIAACEAAIDALVKETWKGKVPPIKEDRKSFRAGEDFVNQTTGEVYSGYEGQMVVVASKGTKGDQNNPDDSSHARSRPTLLTRGKDKVDSDDGLFYAGCRVDAVVRFYTETRKEKGGNGIFATLEAVRFRRDDQPFGSAPVGADAFDDLEEDDDDEMM